MTRTKKPIISVSLIRSLKPGESVTICGVTEKGRSSITTMLGYIKDMGMPRKVIDYASTYDKETGECVVTALGRGMNKLDFWRKRKLSRKNQ